MSTVAHRSTAGGAGARATPPAGRTHANGRPESGSSLPPFGLLEWIHIGDRERVEALIDDIRAIGASYIRTGFSWADYHTQEGPDWYDWLFARLAKEAEVLPCFVYTPPSIGRKPHTASPPRRLEAFAEFIEEALDRYGQFFDTIELWNEGNNHHYWDWYEDPEWTDFAEMISSAAKVAQRKGWKTVLGGMSPTDPPWLWTMGRLGVLDHIDIVGVHGFPDTWDDRWLDWGETLDTVRQTLESGGWQRPLWITEAGYSTWRHDEHRQVLEFVRALDSDAERLFWYSASDLHPDRVSDSGFHRDERHYHFGLRRADGATKLLHRLLTESGDRAIRTVAAHAERVPAVPQPPFPAGESSGDGSADGGAADLKLGREAQAADESPQWWFKTPLRPLVITGGAGFVGTNMASRLLSHGHRVRILDSLHRPGVTANLEWLVRTFGTKVEVELGDVRNTFAVRHAVRDAAAVFHFASQVAVTTSLQRPRQDFEVNAAGTLTVLEAVRSLPHRAPVLFASTNKVYGNLSTIPLLERESWYEPSDPEIKGYGVAETQPLAFHSPYGCSKGAADQYVLDYARNYGLPGVVFRMSCIYGPHQHGNEDQGWVAHFLIRTLLGERVTLFGDGKQVRDILFVDDLLDAMLAALRGIKRTSGRAFNIGGGTANATSLLSLIERIPQVTRVKPAIDFAPARAGDQRYYVSDIRAFEALTGWRPRTAIGDGLNKLHKWLVTQHAHIVRAADVAA